MSNRGQGESASPAIYVEHLRKEYRDKVAVEDLSLQVERGEVFGFLGPNGAGKTTTIKMLNGLVRPTSGRLSVLGRPLGDMEARRRIGFLPEQFRFHEWLRAEEFLDFHGSLYGLSRSERRQRIPEALTLVGLEGRARSRLRTFSKGMLQRIGIAQAVIADPLLVFLDEPTSALDPLGRRDVRDIIRRLQGQGVTVFLNSHLLSEVEAVCDRVAIIKDGRVAAMGPKQELLGGEHAVEVRLSRPPEELLQTLRASYSVLSIRSESQGAVASADGQARSTSLSPTATEAGPGGQVRVSVALSEEDVPDLVSRLTGAGVRIYEVAIRQRSLEDLFVDIVQVGGDR
ncbi:MAG: ABC transporter ATP-binding protein [Chloroflexota bacterium]|nr:ABC transporter ATP-binding protein [Chloroflexota bacterium]